jgi:mannose-6-phosphate isomerase-like protein (cupin superfamily)
MIYENHISQKDKELTYMDSTTIAFVETGKYCLHEDGEDLLLDEASKPCFTNAETGEAVIEFTGFATDGRVDRSWAKACYKTDGYSPLHYHNERTEWYYVTKGQARVIIDGIEQILAPGQFIKILPKQQHQVFSVGEHALEMIVKCVPAWHLQDQLLVAEV